jgi:hypothetical protein
MTGTEFAEQWLHKHGLFDADSDYGGMVGEAVLDVWKLIASQGHSGFSAALVFACLAAIHKEYDDPDSPLWKHYWASAEGKALIKSTGG